jgi:predicted aspartyl protease
MHGRGLGALGVFTYPISVAALPEGPFEDFEAYVDSGAAYTQIAASVLRWLGVSIIDTAVFVTADGRRVESELGEIVLRIDGRTRRSICVFGEEGTPPILGAYALEGFLLGVDPVNRRLIPVEGLRLRLSLEGAHDS